MAQRGIQSQRHIASDCEKFAEQKEEGQFEVAAFNRCVPCRIKPMLYQPRDSIKKRYPSP